MAVNRMAFIVYYRGKQVVRKIEKMNVNLVYVSNKMSYLVFFGEERLEKTYFNEIKKVKGFLKFEKSLLFKEDTNFSLTSLENDVFVDIDNLSLEKEEEIIEEDK